MALIKRQLNCLLNDNKQLTELLNSINEHYVERKCNFMYDTQLATAIEILSHFDSDIPRCNHVILKGETQAGKTGVMSSLINIIDWHNLYEFLNINSIYVITGDNSIKLKEQNSNRLGLDKNNKCNFYFYKNSDLKNDKENIELKNALIIIDESHYGVNNEKNILIKWLERKGLNMKNNINLLIKNIYIVSCSATPYNEMMSDIIKCKKEVTLRINRWDNNKNFGYVGVDEFYNNNNIKNAKHALNNIVEFCKKINNDLINIEEITGKRKGAIVRLSSKTYEKHKNILNEYFDIKCIKSEKNKNIEYETIHEFLKEKDMWHFKKYPMVIIIGAYRMGITIPKEVKKNIGVIYDYVSAEDCVCTTIQGLLGRMTGYWNADDWKDLNIYVNINHIEKLKDYKEQKLSNPLSKKKGIFKEKEDGNEVSIIPISSQYTYLTDEEFDKNMINKIQKEGKSSTYAFEVKEYLKNNFNVDLEGYIILDVHRNYEGNYKTKTLKDFSSVLNGNTTVGILSNKENINKKCYTFIYDIDNHQIKLLYGKIVKGEWQEIEENKITETLSTKLNLN